MCCLKEIFNCDNILLIVIIVILLSSGNGGYCGCPSR